MSVQTLKFQSFSGVSAADDETASKAPQLQMKSYYTEAEANDPKFKCNPGQSVTVECNTCWCGDNGKLDACTLVGCLGPNWSEVRPN